MNPRRLGAVALLLTAALLVGCTPAADEDRCVAPASGQGPWVEADDGEPCVWDGSAWVEADDDVHKAKKSAKSVKSARKSAKSRSHR